MRTAGASLAPPPKHAVSRGLMISAVAEIYGHKKAKEAEFNKDPLDHATLDKEHREHNIISSNNENHRRQRRLLSHAFSEAALRHQEPLLQGYVDLFVKRLKEQAKAEGPVDISKWLNFTTVRYRRAGDSPCYTD